MRRLLLCSLLLVAVASQAADVLVPAGSDIQAAVDRASVGDVLRFDPGTYTSNKSIIIKKSLVIDGTGAVFVGTNPDDQAWRVTVSGVTLRNLTIRNISDVRRSKPQHAGIALYSTGTWQIKNTLVENCNISGASSAGIIAAGAIDFIFRGNTITRTRADGIHMTSASRGGLVENNTVRETGDDTIAVVSYRGIGSSGDILIQNNKVGGNWHGRGITVVGGDNVIIRNNEISGTTAAGVYVGREKSYRTLGVVNVLIEGNSFSDIQTRQPSYNPTGKPIVMRGHGAIQLVSSLNADELDLREELQVVGITRRNNTFTRLNGPQYKDWDGNGIIAGVRID